MGWSHKAAACESKVGMRDRRWKEGGGGETRLHRCLHNVERLAVPLAHREVPSCLQVAHSARATSPAAAAVHRARGSLAALDAMTRRAVFVPVVAEAPLPVLVTLCLAAEILLSLNRLRPSRVRERFKRSLDRERG